MSTTKLTEDQMREARVRAYWAWAKDHPQTAIAHFHGGEPPAMRAVAAKVQLKTRKAKPRRVKQRRNPRGSLSQHNAMMRRLHGKNWRPKGHA